MVLKYPMLILYYFRLLSCSPSSFFHSLHHAGGSFSKRQSAPPSLFRPDESSSHTPGRHSSPFRSLFIPSFTSFPASQSPRSQVAPVLIRPPFFCQLIPLPSTPLKVSVCVRPSRPASVPLPPPSISAPAANRLSQTSDKSRASKLIIYRDGPESVALKG